MEFNGARLEIIETLYEKYEPVKPKRVYCPHLCFETNDMDKTIKILKENSIEIIDGPHEITNSEKWINFMDSDYNVLEYIQWLKK